MIWTESLHAEDTTWLSRADKELASYLNSPALPYLKSFTILDWWCVNESQYSTLACMAWDILSIPITSVGVEWVFSHAWHVLDFCQNWLSATSIQKIMMSKYWLQYEERLHQEEKWQKNQQSNRWDSDMNKNICALEHAQEQQLNDENSWDTLMLSELESLYTDNELEVTEDNNYLVMSEVSDDEDDDELNQTSKQRHLS